jgi:hypothetical protein
LVDHGFASLEHCSCARRSLSIMHRCQRVEMPRMNTRMMTLCAALLLLPSAAFAAPTSSPSRNDEGAEVKTDGPVRELIFGEDEDIEGEVLNPNGVNIGGRRAQDHANMIGIRGQFIAQLIALSNDI